MADEEFPIDLAAYQQVSIDPWASETLSDDQRAALTANIQLTRDAIVMFTACGGASGYGGHTGGAYDTMPEVCILDAFFRACPDKFVPILFDEAGHRVATQYLFSALRGHLPAGKLLGYRQGNTGLPGHPELGRTPGIQFSSGRLGHIWPFVNGMCRGEPGKVVTALSSDGSQMEGNTAEAARIAVANGFNIKLFIDDNDVTIAGHPSEYLKGYNVGKTLAGHGLATEDVPGEDLDALFAAMVRAVKHDGPYAVVLKRPMAPSMEGVEGSCHGHDAVAKPAALKYLNDRGHTKAAARLEAQQKINDPYQYLGCGAMGAPRQVFGTAVVEVVKQLPAEERSDRVWAFDSDLEGSCGMQKIREGVPEVYTNSGVMERGNFSACAGFGFKENRQGIFGTFAAFQEMIISEATMARLNKCNVICHFSHSGVDGMSDNMCHFGQNNFFADGGLQDEDALPTRLYFPADVHQMKKVVQAIFWERGLRFIYSTRSSVPEILNPADQKPFFGDGYEFQPNKDDVIFGSGVGFIVTYGDALYRCVDAVTRLRQQGIEVGLISKCQVNVIDEDAMQLAGKSKFVLVVESQNTKTGLGVRFGTWLLERGLSPRFKRCGTHTDGVGGQWEQSYGQGYDPESVMGEVRKLLEAC
jgi:transketolase